MEKLKAVDERADVDSGADQRPQEDEAERCHGEVRHVLEPLVLVRARGHEDDQAQHDDGPHEDAPLPAQLAEQVVRAVPAPRNRKQW
jgi:hypothetical protein